MRDWKTVPLSEVVKSLIAGVSVNSEDRPARNDEIGVLRTSCVTGGIFEPTENKAVLPDEIGRVRETPSRGGILISRMNTPDLVGASAYVDADYPTLYLPDRLWQLRIINEKQYSPRWLAFVLASEHMRAVLASRATGTSGSMKNLSKRAFLSVHINCPSYEEQNAIADLLATWEEAEAKTRRLARALEKRRRALVQHLFADGRASLGVGGANQHRRELLGGFFRQRREAGRRGLPVLSVTIDRGLVHRRSIDRKLDSALRPEDHKLVKAGDIVYNMMRMWQGAFGLAKEEGIVSPAYVVCSPKRDIDPRFASHLFRHPMMLRKFTDYSYGITGDRLRLYFKDFAKIPVQIPPLEEQEHVVDVLDTVDREIELLTQQAEALKLQKKGLMQKLLTGQIRVKT